MKSKACDRDAPQWLAEGACKAGMFEGHLEQFRFDALWQPRRIDSL